MNIEGEVSTSPVLKEVNTPKGETVKLAVFGLKNATGTVRVSAWRNLAKIVNNLKVGDWILIENDYLKKGLEDRIELSTRNSNSIRVREP